MWKTNITITDKLRNETKHLTYNFCKVTTYLKLLQNLPKIYPELCSTPCKISFVFNYFDEVHIIDDLSKYILNGDNIEIIITEPDPIYYLCDVKTGNKIKESRKVSDLYMIYNSCMQTMDCEVLLIKNDNHTLTLIDVLDFPKRQYNECVNRLIHRYNY